MFTDVNGKLFIQSCLFLNICCQGRNRVKFKVHILFLTRCVESFFAGFICPQWEGNLCMSDVSWPAFERETVKAHVRAFILSTFERSRSNRAASIMKPECSTD